VPIIISILAWLLQSPTMSRSASSTCLLLKLVMVILLGGNMHIGKYRLFAGVSVGIVWVTQWSASRLGAREIKGSKLIAAKLQLPSEA